VTIGTSRLASTDGENADVRDALGNDLRDRVLDRLGFAAPPPLTIEGLNALYAAWGRSVPFDNLQKRLALATGAATSLPCATPAEFFARYLAHGTGATCWPSSIALHALLCACDFDAIRLAGTMESYEGINHGSVLVRVAGDEFLVDTWMASEVALPLARDGTSAGVGAYRVRAEPYGPLWRVWWLHPTREQERYFEVKERDVDFSRVLTRYESTRTDSPFNARLFARKNVTWGVVCLARGARHSRDASGITRRELAPADIAQVLIEDFGYPEDIVARLPPDEPIQ
jgi:N-hydroxyarylamine O-acetyltransferase